jgi:hypothetical protein
MMGRPACVGPMTVMPAFRVEYPQQLCPQEFCPVESTAGPARIHAIETTSPCRYNSSR